MVRFLKLCYAIWAQLRNELGFKVKTVERLRPDTFGKFNLLFPDIVPHLVAFLG
jgi:hypothetical protein